MKTKKGSTFFHQHKHLLKDIEIFVIGLANEGKTKKSVEKDKINEQLLIYRFSGFATSNGLHYRNRKTIRLHLLGLSYREIMQKTNISLRETTMMVREFKIRNAGKKLEEFIHTIIGLPLPDTTYNNNHVDCIDNKNKILKNNKIYTLKYYTAGNSHKKTWTCALDFYPAYKYALANNLEYYYLIQYTPGWFTYPLLKKIYVNEEKITISKNEFSDDYLKKHDIINKYIFLASNNESANSSNIFIISKDIK
jgi:hypothetical protein